MNPDGTVAPGSITAPTTAGRTVDATASAAPAPATQIAMQLVPLRKGPDGVHRLTIHLNPGDLGPISVVAEVRNGAIAVALSGATEAGREALISALPDLRRDLVDAGFGSCSLDLRDAAPDPRQFFHQPRGQADRGGNPDGTRSAGSGQPDPARQSTPAPPGTGATQNCALDLRV